jgi:small subunit ribosomal protein S6
MADQDNATENAVATTDATASDAPVADVATDATEETPATEATASTEETTSTDVSTEEASTEAPARSTQLNTPQPELNDVLAPVNGDAAAERKEVVGGRPYEIIYISRVGDNEATEASTARVRAIVEGGEGAIDNVRVSEPRRLAYPIDKEIEGLYVVINGRFKKELTSELERYFKIEESVLRHMILREDQ